MKTSEQYVTVDIEIDDRPTKHNFPIRGKGGVLMTHRLRRLLSGNVTHYYDSEKRSTVFFHYVGASWKPPYGLLQEILQGRMERQKNLKALYDKHSELSKLNLKPLLMEPPIVIPEKAKNDRVTKLVLKELALRHELGIKLREAERVIAETKKSGTPTEPASDAVPRPYTM